MTVFLITGPPAVGKSTVARLVARARPRCVLVEVDRIRDAMVVSGMVIPGAEWTPDLVEQLVAARRSAAAIAREYDAIGFDTVIDDFLDPHSLLTEYEGLADLAPVRIALLPRPDVARARNLQRGQGGDYIDAGITFVYERLPATAVLSARGWSVLDTSREGPEQTGQRILALAG